VEEKKWGCLKQTAIGCVVLIVLAVVFPIVLGVMMMGPFNRAVDARSDIEERFGTQEAFVPPPSGAPAPDRIEAFLEVRRALSVTCSDFGHMEEQVKELESFDGQDEVSRLEVVKQALSTGKSMMGMGPLIGNFYETRNHNLLEAEMGLGEYTYIYVLAYREQILDPSEDLQLLGPRIVNRRVRRALVSMLGNQLQVLRDTGAAAKEIAALENELAVLEEDSARILWQDGLPPTIADAIDPFRKQLDAVHCPATAPLELMLNEKRGPAVETL
jgi:hypothetical protein